jgi:hypothetical protein
MTITVIGLDLAKNVFQVHGIDGNGRAVLRRKIRQAGRTTQLMPRRFARLYRDQRCDL